MTLTTTMAVANGDITILPEGWVLTHLGEVCQINPAKPARDAVAVDSPVTFVPMPAVDAIEGAITAPKTKAFAEVRKGFTSFRNNDVIMAKITPCMENGKAAVARNLTNGLGFGSTEFHVLRPTKAVLPDYVYAFIRQESYRRAAESEMTGSVGQKRVPQSFLELTKLPLPPLAEQIRIVQKLTELLTYMKTCRERLGKMPSILKYFRQAVLDAACSGRLTEEWRAAHPKVEPALELARRVRQNHIAEGFGHGGQAAIPTEDVHDLNQTGLPDSWVIEESQFLCQPGRPITYGILKPGPDCPGGVPYIRVADFPKDCLKRDGIRKTTQQIANMYRRSALKAGDVLLSIRGTAGRVCRVPPGLDGANITQDTARLSVHAEICADYIEIYLRCPSAQKRLERAMKGVAVRGVNIGDVRVLQIALPPKDEQAEIARRVLQLFKAAEVIENHLVKAVARADRTTQSIVAKAFRGELVPAEAELAQREGREYEPASVLLERIWADKANQAKSLPISKRKLKKSRALVGV